MHNFPQTSKMERRHHLWAIKSYATAHAKSEESLESFVLPCLSYLSVN